MFFSFCFSDGTPESAPHSVHTPPHPVSPGVHSHVPMTLPHVPSHVIWGQHILSASKFTREQVYKRLPFPLEERGVPPTSKFSLLVFIYFVFPASFGKIPRDWICKLDSSSMDTNECSKYHLENTKIKTPRFSSHSSKNKISLQRAVIWNALLNYDTVKCYG